MSPEITWSEHFTKNSTKLNPVAVEWKTLMNECLMETKILREREESFTKEKYLTMDPKVIMNIRHEMARSNTFTKMFPSPIEQIQTEARQLLRFENRKKLAKLKEERIIKNEIQSLKEILDNFRHATEENLKEGTIKKECCSMFSLHSEKFTTLCKRLESHDGSYKLNLRLEKARQNSLESEDSCTRKLKVYLKTKKDSVKMTENSWGIVSSDRKKSSVSYKTEHNLNDNSQYWDHSQSNAKNEIMQRFFESNINIPEIKECSFEERSQIKIDDHEKNTISNSSSVEKIKLVDSQNDLLEKREFWEKQQKISKEEMNRWRIEYAWKMWKNFTKRQIQKRKEVKNYECKIEAFLGRLKESKNDVRELVPKKGQNKRDAVNDKVSKSLIQTEENKERKILSKEEIHKKKRCILDENLCKESQVKRIMEEIKSTQKETQERLGFIRDNQTKRSVLTNNSKSDSTMEEVKKIFPLPEFLKRMEKRREERNIRWKEIKDRKQKLKEERENIEKEKEEQIKKMEMEEKRRKLEELKQRENLEKEKMEERRLEREKMKNRMRLAEQHCKIMLLRNYGFSPWLNLLKLRKIQREQAVLFHERKLLEKGLSQWKINAMRQMNYLRNLSEIFYSRILQKYYFRIWMNICKERTIQIQAAIDWNELKISEKFFNKWLMFIRDEKLSYTDKKAIAQSYFEKKLKKICFTRWRNYPDTRRAELEKEARKRIWRQKIKEIIPDYCPESI